MCVPGIIGLTLCESIGGSAAGGSSAKLALAVGSAPGGLMVPMSPRASALGIRLPRPGGGGGRRERLAGHHE